MRWILSIAAIFFGIAITDFGSTKWLVLTAGLYSIPLIGQFVKSKTVQIYSVWLAFFLVFQALATPLLIDDSFKTMAPNMQKVRNVIAGLPGIQGRQELTTDRMGFRTTQDIEYESEAGFRVFAIGASTTADISLDDRGTWTHLLQNRLAEHVDSDVEVINTGVSGLRAEHHLATLEHILPWHPDLVIFLLGLNDWNHQIANQFSGTGLRRGLRQFRDKYSFQTTLLGRTVTVIASLLSSSKYASGQVIEERGDYYTHQRNSLDRADKRTYRPSAVSQDYSDTLLAISELCKQYEIDCIFVTQPTGYKDGATEVFKEGFWMTPPNKEYTLDFESMKYIASLYNSHLLQFGEEREHFVCDAAAILPASYDVFYDDCHFNTNGAVMMSNVVADCVADFYRQHNNVQTDGIRSKENLELFSMRKTGVSAR